jgi:predicted nucleic acid-binding protein
VKEAVKIPLSSTQECSDPLHPSNFNIRNGENGMKRGFRFLPIGALIILLMALSPHLQAQRLYDGARDKEAQDAAKLAEEITSKSSFEKQLKNLDTLSQRDMEVYFRGAQRQMALEIRTFRTWGQVSLFVERAKGILGAEDFIPTAEVQKIIADLKKDCQREDDIDKPTRETELGKSICLAKIRMKILKAAADKSKERGEELDEELETRLEKIDQINSLIEKAESYLKSGSNQNETIKGFSEVFVNLSKSYVNYVNKIDKIKNEPKDELKLLLQRIAVEVLQLEADHWETVAEIKLRRGKEQEDLEVLATDVDDRLVQISRCLSIEPADLAKQRLNVTFAKAQSLPKCTIEIYPKDAKGRGEVELSKESITTYLYQTLHSAAALAARGQTPMKLAELRFAQEEHRYSIRHSAVMARSYEVALTSGTKRLARYYAGGLKPEKIAQMVYSAATLAIPTVIAVK